LADRAVGVEEPFTQFVECGPPMKDQVVAQFDLRKEQPVLATCLSRSSAAAVAEMTRALVSVSAVTMIPDARLRIPSIDAIKSYASISINRG
jgi:hypothetical protein